MDLKRAFDLVVGTVVGFFALPVVFTAVAGMGFATQSNPIYKQERIGLNGESFTMYKIKTMTDARNADGHLLPDEDRLVRFGGLMRALRIDELPQLYINIIDKGDMSLVGPRPAPSYMVSLASDFERHKVKPGATGLAQVLGQARFTDEKICLLDHLYVRHRNILVDGILAAITVPAILINSSIPHMRPEGSASNASKPVLG